MRGLRQALGMLVFGAIIVAGTHSVLAQGLWGPGTWSVYGFGARSWSTSRPGPPYFPVHPPVYYGRQVRQPPSRPPAWAGATGFCLPRAEGNG